MSTNIDSTGPSNQIRTAVGASATVAPDLGSVRLTKACAPASREDSKRASVISTPHTSAAERARVLRLLETIEWSSVRPDGHDARSAGRRAAVTAPAPVPTLTLILRRR